MLARLVFVCLAASAVFGLNQNARADDDEQRRSAVRCYAAHFVRLGGGEMRFTVISFNNGDLQNEATIERLTIRDADGTILHDSGPKVGVPHPLNMAPIPPRDFTTVSPGAHFAFSTSDLWGFNPVPQHVMPLNRGTELISVQVEFSKAGKRSLFQVSAREITRFRFQMSNGSFSVGDERAANMAPCFPVEPS